MPLIGRAGPCGMSDQARVACVHNVFRQFTVVMGPQFVHATTKVVHFAYSRITSRHLFGVCRGIMQYSKPLCSQIVMLARRGNVQISSVTEDLIVLYC